MDTYTLLRQLADSWVLLAMFGFFASVAVWAFLPSQRRAREDASLIPFRNEDAPKHSTGPSKGASQPPEALRHD